MMTYPCGERERNQGPSELNVDQYEDSDIMREGICLDVTTKIQCSSFKY